MSMSGRAEEMQREGSHLQGLIHLKACPTVPVGKETFKSKRYSRERDILSES